MSKETEELLPPCQIFINKEGLWYHEGAEMIHREFIKLFFENMELDSHGRYVIDWNDQRCYVDVEDTAFVVQRAFHEDKNRFLLSLNDDTQEELDPETLLVGKQNVLYCRVKNGAFPARFNRAAYYQLAQYVEEDSGTFYLPGNGEKYVIAYAP